ncbi:hypothetical protein SEA_SCAP1_39 [Streptomyces phage Scap1]|uniref:Uncharacterized protein n=1 Tax=Streptomyces phage Scap1 TaxID=2041354 RepID=A0A2D1GP00_9CAUD|nr:hypothetical protein FDI71_gp39 [Streptomyces phage Scap1]ATN93688.1 hypothetical protein SEA_SCAP1_39 [Streptomyces phage Scap1]
MNALRAAANVVTSKVGRQILLTQKHSPTIMFAAGAVGFVTTAVLASKATLKMDGILREAEEDRAKIEKAETEHSDKYSAEDADKDRKLSRVKLAIEVAKAYAPAIVVGAGTLALFTGAHVILQRRVVGLTAAYAAVDKAFKEYRARVVADLGADKDAEYRYDLVDKEIYHEDENGPTTKVVKAPSGGCDAGTGSMYAVLFDESNRNFKKDWGYNQTFLAAQQTWANNKLRADGHIFLNDVYRMLGLPDTKAGAVTGWIDGGDGDDTVIFNIFGPNGYEGDRFAEVNERAVWIDFNVDGVIYDKI